MKTIQKKAVKLLFLISCVVSLLAVLTPGKCQPSAHNFIIKGTITNYNNRPLTLFKCYEDTLLFVDSLRTDKKGRFAFPKPASTLQNLSLTGLFKIQLHGNQNFLFLRQNAIIQIQTLYSDSPFYNIATDSLVVTGPQMADAKAEKFIDFETNKLLYHFQHLQQEINVANYYLLQMMRLYPLSDPFHIKMEEEYAERNQRMEGFVRQQMLINPEKMSSKVALAYFQPVLPDWKLPDPVRDSILAVHFFDLFHPSDTFYLHSNILPEKMELYLALKTNKKDQFGGAVEDELVRVQSAAEFIRLTKRTSAQTIIDQAGTYRFCLNYFLKIFKKEHRDKAFLALYDSNLQTRNGDCGTTELDRFSWARDYANQLKGTLIGAVAPDFYLEKDGLKLSSLKSDYILLVFWASWCPHCAQLLPQLRDLMEPVREKVSTVAISVDSDTTRWKIFVKENQLMNWLNTSELKGWQGVTPKLYNIYATPSLFLLDKERKILAKPVDVAELKSWMDKIR